MCLLALGEREFQTLLPKFTSSSDPPALTDPIDGMIFVSLVSSFQMNKKSKIGRAR